MNVAVVVPALNEAGCIAELVHETLAQAVQQVIVVDNGSTDHTSREAERAGATVVSEPRRGYGYACAAGVAVTTEAEVVAFLDGDFSFSPAELPNVLGPVLRNEADLALGSRVLGHIAAGSMPYPQRFGNWLVAGLVQRLYGVPVTDLGPFRAIRRDLLVSLDMREMAFGWPTEMTVKAARKGARIVEMPVSYHARRAGQSKVSGTVRGVVLAGLQITGVAMRYARWRPEGGHR